MNSSARTLERKMKNSLQEFLALSSAHSGAENSIRAWLVLFQRRKEEQIYIESFQPRSIPIPAPKFYIILAHARDFQSQNFIDFMVRRFNSHTVLNIINMQLTHIYRQIGRKKKKQLGEH